MNRTTNQSNKPQRMTKREIYLLFSPPLRMIIRRLYYLPVDIYRYFTGKTERLTPPKGMIFVGGGDFKQLGNHLMNKLITHAGLQPHHRVLDIGCGIGRLAVPLTTYLNEKGSYEGFDIVRSGIRWCQKNITPQYPNFNFRHVSLKNDLYNLDTRNEAKNYVFPYNDNEFDVVFLFSVFSHMLPDDTSNYLQQIQRVLKDKGVCYATFFVLSEENQQLSENGSGLKFRYDRGQYALYHRKVKEATVAYKEDYLKELIRKNNLEIAQTHYGHWPGRVAEKCLDFQDVLILRKQ